MKNNNPRSLSTIFKKILLKRKFLVLKFILLDVSSSLFFVFLPYFSKLQIDQLNEQSHQVLGIRTTPLLVFAAFILAPTLIRLIDELVLTPLMRRSSIVLNYKLGLDVERIIWRKMIAFDLGFFQSKRNQHLMMTAIGSSQVLEGVIRFIRDNLESIVTLAAVIPLVLNLDYQLLVLILAAAIGQAVISELRQKLKIGQGFVANIVDDKSYNIKNLMLEKLGKLKEIGAAEELLDEYIQQNERARNIDLSHQRTNDRTSTYRWLIDNIFYIAANLFVAQQIFSGDISLGTFTLTVTYIDRVRHSFSEVFSIKNRYKELKLDVTKLKFILNLKSRLKTSTKQLVIRQPRSLKLKQVNFTYPGFYQDEKKFYQEMVSHTQALKDDGFGYWRSRELKEWQQMLAEVKPNRQVLFDINFNLKIGHLVALVGRNGSGKTTLTKLLLHSYEPDLGLVLLNEKPVPDYNQQQFRRLSSYLQQMPFLLPRFSIRDNLLLGIRRKVSDEEILTVLEQLDLRKVISRYDKGLDLILSEDASFSGGQKQLLVMARTLLQQRPFILFDEGSSQLDVEKETKVLKLLSQQKQNSGILFITHHMTVARRADYIYVIDDGRIVEEGQHRQLIQKEGLYYQFWQMQVID